MGLGEQDNKRARLDPPPVPHLSATPTPTSQQTPSQLPTLPTSLSQGSLASGGGGNMRGNLAVINKELPPEQHRPRILLSSIKNKEDVERVSCMDFPKIKKKKRERR